MSKNAPPLILGEDTSNTPPSQNTSAGGGSCSVLKLLRKLITAAAELTLMGRLSSTLSLTPSWSGMKAALGAVSGVAVEVTHRVPSPGSGFVATQPVGSAGAVTPSKLSVHGPPPGVAVGVGVGVPPGGVGVGVPPGVPVGPGVGVGVGVPPGVPVGPGVGVGP